MTALKVLFIIGAVLFLLSLIRLGGRVQYEEDGLGIWLIAGPVRAALYPGKKREKPEKPKKRKKAGGKKPAEEPPGGGEKKGGQLGLVRQLLPLAAEAAGQLKRKIRIDELTIHLTWAAEDPMQAALGFGRANAALGVIWPLIDENFRVGKRDLGVAVSYEQSRPSVRLSAAVTASVGQLVSFGIRFGIKFLKIIYRNRKGSAKKQEAAL